MVICGLSLTDGWTGCAGEASVCLWDPDSESEPLRPALADPRASAQISKAAYLRKGRAPHRVNRRLGPTGAPHQPAQRHDRQRITYGMRRPRIRPIGPVRSRPFRTQRVAPTRVSSFAHSPSQRTTRLYLCLHILDTQSWVVRIRKTKTRRRSARLAPVPTEYSFIDTFSTPVARRIRWRWPSRSVRSSGTWSPINRSEPSPPFAVSCRNRLRGTASSPSSS
jgi:hypothetical protein